MSRSLSCLSVHKRVALLSVLILSMTIFACKKHLAISTNIADYTMEGQGLVIAAQGSSLMPRPEDSATAVKAMPVNTRIDILIPKNQDIVKQIPSEWVIASCQGSIGWVRRNALFRSDPSALQGAPAAVRNLRMVVTSNENRFLIDGLTETPRLLTIQGTIICASPDSRYILTARMEEPGGIGVYDRRTGKTGYFHSGSMGGCASFSWSPGGNYLVADCDLGHAIVFDFATKKEVTSFNAQGYKWIGEKWILANEKDSKITNRPWGAGEAIGVVAIDLAKKTKSPVMAATVSSEYRFEACDKSGKIYVREQAVDGGDWSKSDQMRIVCHELTIAYPDITAQETPAPGKGDLCSPNCPAAETKSSPDLSAYRRLLPVASRNTQNVSIDQRPGMNDWIIIRADGRVFIGNSKGQDGSAKLFLPDAEIDLVF